VVSGAIQYSISNAQKAILHIQDFDKSLEALALGIILEFASKRTLEECENIDLLKKEILQGIKAAAGDWGLRIQKIYITDLGEAKNFRLLTNKTKEIIEGE